jgi:hypothetical protein
MADLVPWTPTITLTEEQYEDLLLLTSGLFDPILASPHVFYAAETRQQAEAAYRLMADGLIECVFVRYPAIFDYRLSQRCIAACGQQEAA